MGMVQCAIGRRSLHILSVFLVQKLVPKLAVLFLICAFRLPCRNLRSKIRSCTETLACSTALSTPPPISFLADCRVQNPDADSNLGITWQVFEYLADSGQTVLHYSRL
eukprot:6469278-Amphidinium_carterae.1